MQRFPTFSSLLILVVAGLLASPSEAQAPIRILPLGDSITYGAGAPGGYRNKLFQSLTTAGYNVDLIGNATGNGVASLPDPDHEGHSGWIIGQIDANIESWLGSIADPDVVLLHIGTNDFGQGVDTANAINRLDALITLIATLRPYAHVIVTNLLERGEPHNTSIETLFNPFVQSTVAAQAALGRRVTFLDMRSAVPLAEMPDNLHPNQVGYDHMADAWVPAIQAVIGPDGDGFPPAIVRAQGDPDQTHVAVTFSKPVADSAATVGNFVISDGLTVSAAELDASKRIVTLTTPEHSTGIEYTITVNGVVDRTVSMLPLPPDSSVEFLAATPRGYLNNVPESVGYTLVHSLDIPNVASYATNAVVYSVDNRTSIGDFSRVAYYIELRRATDDLQYVWASMDAFTAEIGKLGVPTAASAALFQQGVTGLSVSTNVAGLDTLGLAGNLEFWPTNYATGNAAAVPGASESTFDFGDTRVLNGTYGSMQLHNTAAGQTLFAYNNWGGSGSQGDGDLGVGNDPSPVSNGVDWTFHHNAAGYSVKTLQVLVQASGDTTRPTLVSATSFGGTQIAVRFSEPLAAASIQPTDFSFNASVSVLGVTIGANQRDVNLQISALPAGAPLALSVTGVTDSSPAANPIFPGSTIAVAVAPATGGIVKTKLRDIVSGSETTALVDNGGFEDSSSGNNYAPVGWNRVGNMFYDGHAGIDVPVGAGANSARIHIDSGSVGNYNQSVPLVANTDYVLSAYMWHLGDSTHTGTVELDLSDRPYEPNDGSGSIRITQGDSQADEGYFVYGAFNPGAETSVTLRAFMVYAENNGWPNQPTGALWDNIAITPANAFVPPTNVPSVVEIVEFVRDEVSDLLTLSWTTEPGETYSVLYSIDLVDWNTQLVGSIPATGSQLSYGPFADPAIGSSLVFFRVQRD